MNTENTPDIQDTDDLIMDSMLRQFVNAEVQRFRFAEKVYSAIRTSNHDDQDWIESQELAEDLIISRGEWTSGHGRLVLRCTTVAAVAATILLAVWLPMRPDNSVEKLAFGSRDQQLIRSADEQFNDAGSTKAKTAPQQHPPFSDSKNTNSNDQVSFSGHGSTAISDKATGLPQRFPQRSELMLAADAGSPIESMKIVRAENGEKVNPTDIANVDIQARPPLPTANQDLLAQSTEATKPALDEKIERMDASLFPTRKLMFKIEVVGSKSEHAYVSINDGRISKKIRNDNLARGLKLLEPEISRRVRFIGPRVGEICGTIRFQSVDARFGLDFENERQLRGAFTRICNRLETMGPSRRRNRYATSAEQFLTLALKKTNEVLRKWAKDSLMMGNVSLEPGFESEARFQRVISKDALERFAETGYFKIPDPDQIYLPSTQLQYLQPENLRDDLKRSTRQLDLFASTEEMKEFVGQFKNSRKRKRDGVESFEPLKAMLQHRDDLQGLPLVMNEDCHMDQERSQTMDSVSRTVGPILNRFDRFASRNANLHPTARRQMLESQITNVKSHFPRMSDSPQALLTIDQMLQIEDPKIRTELVKLLEESRSPMSASLLACYAKFDLSSKVRTLATSALSGFPRSFYREKLIEGMRYPWPEAAKHSAEALVRLNDVESIPVLVEMLKEPDPRVPREREGRYVKKELVAINHLKNCMLCHADSQRDTDRGRAPVPTWEEPLPRTYYNFRSPGLLMARADITYMRQDFSVVQEVKDAKPWPKHQRFDYVVQNRELSQEEYQQLSEQITMDSNEYEQAIVFALRMLTGKKPSDNSYDSWKTIASRLHVLP